MNPDGDAMGKGPLAAQGLREGQSPGARWRTSGGSAKSPLPMPGAAPVPEPGIELVPVELEASALAGPPPRLVVPSISAAGQTPSTSAAAALQ